MKGIKGAAKDLLPILLTPSLGTASAFFEAGNNMLVSSMHFQDVYNFDIERVSRCLVHYGMIDPDDRTKVLQIPFCAFNSIHRENVELKLKREDVNIDPEELNAKMKDFISKEIGE